VGRISAGAEVGSAGTDPDGILNVAIRDVISEVGDATVV
jgi:porphobilinogen synthase